MAAGFQASPSSPAYSSMKAQGVRPISRRASETAAAGRRGVCRGTFSTSIEEIFSPPEMMMSLERSIELDIAVGVHDADRPNENQPPWKASAEALGS